MDDRFSMLKETSVGQGIKMHTDLLSILPTEIAPLRQFKPDRIRQEELTDRPGGAHACRLCVPELLDLNPQVSYHLDGRVMSFPNVSPYLPGDQRVLALWHSEPEQRYAHAHKVRLADFSAVELYYLTRTAAELAQAFPSTRQGRELCQDRYPARCITGFNLGPLAGQSVRHVHAQYGFDLAIDPKVITPAKLSCFYEEMRDADLVLHEDDTLMLVAPWTPKGPYNLELHFPNRYELRELGDVELRAMAYFGDVILTQYRKLGIQNMNILFTGSPYLKTWEPLRVQFIPRVDQPALYEMTGVTVVSTSPGQIAAFFINAIRWRDVARTACEFDPERAYAERFQPAALPTA